MRRATGFAVLLALMLWPAEAHLSGSSTVFAESKFFRVEIESVRKRFIHPDDETVWHKEWRAKNQPRVDQARALLEAEMPALVKQYPLIAYHPDQPTVIEETEDDDEVKAILAAKKPFLYQLRVNPFSVIVGFSKLPSAEARRAFKQALRKVLPGE